MDILILIIAILVLFAAVFIAVGLFADNSYEGESTELIDAKAEQVWKYLTTPELTKKYRKEVKDVHILEKDEQGIKRFKETTDMGGYIDFEITERRENVLIKIEMKDSSFGMTGSWTYILEPKNGKTSLTIKESTVINKFFIKLILTLVGRYTNLKKEFKNVKAYIAESN